MRNCNCAGGCGPQDDNDGLTRREFLALAGVGAASLIWIKPGLAQGLSAQNPALQAPAAEFAAWQRALREPAPPRVYFSDIHHDARMHLGGIGTGNFEIGADGQFTTWQLFNTLRDGMVPFYFAVRSGVTAKLLQTAGGPDLPRIGRIEMTGEYPLATLRFVDADLPVRVEMTAFSPFAPLDTKLSSIPLAAFVFRVHNPTNQAQTVSLAGFMQNPVGYDAAGQINGVEHPNYGGNVNEATMENGAATLLMRAVAGQTATLDKPLHLFSNVKVASLKAPPDDRPQTLTLDTLENLPAADKLADGTIIWIEDPPLDISPALARSMRDAVRAGALVVFSGDTKALLQAATQREKSPAGGVRADIVYEDFEGDYAKWTAQGEAFGARPAAGALPNQQAVAGIIGKGLVNSFLNGDDTTGRLVSKAFTIERNFVRFFISGGSHATTQMRLIVNEKTVRAASGRNEERLLPASWDVREFAGQTAHLEIWDDQKGAWGHINVDQIEFSDLPSGGAAMEFLTELMPANFNETNPDFDHWELKPGSRRLTANGTNFIGGSVGKGQSVIGAGSLLGKGNEVNQGARQRAYAMLAELAGARYVAVSGTLPNAPGFGTLALATSGPAPTCLTSFDDWKSAWRSFSGSGFAPPREAKPNAPTAPGRTVNGALATTLQIGPGQTVEAPFFLAWHYPNKYNESGVAMGTHYTTQWSDARAVLRETVAEFAALREKTERFRTTFYDSTLPYWLLDCVSSQASIICHIGVVFRIANGDIYGWEGSNGCCQPTCTHVWGYEQSLAALFPDLEKEMRRIDFKHQQSENGGINNRTDVPSPPHPTGERPFTDGHASCVLKAYREALNHPDDSWLKDYWPGIRSAVDYLVARDAATSKGVPNGVLEDDQFNTYDEALHGVTTFIGTYYLAALRAGEELAKRLNDNATASRYRSIFEKGQQRLVELCWNGEYFEQNLPDYNQRDGEIGPGCMADQLIGQWWAHQLGLGYLLPKEQVQTALRSIYKYNFLTDHTNWKHSQRWFAGGKDKGLLICSWPKGGRPPRAMPYVDEVWTGIEYQVASHMIHEGLTDEAFAIIKGARDRYDGIPRAPMGRNPWNEIECGGHYARAMSSWSLLTALSGWHYDGPDATLRFTPRHTPDAFKSFWIADAGWGSLRQSRQNQTQTNQVTVAEGQLRIARLRLEAPATAHTMRLSVGNKPVAAKLQKEDGLLLVTPAAPLLLKRGETLSVSLT